jgi:hypothetical protein
MDAHHKSPRNRTLIERLAVAALAVLLIAGLWQGYGAWLIATVKSHVG